MAERQYNELPRARPKGLFAQARDVLREPMIFLLVVVAALYALMGDAMEATALGVSVFGVIALTLYQTRKAEGAIEKLRDLSSPRALVVRGGVEQRIPARELTVGDEVILVEGDRIPADGVVTRSAALEVDESLLTGESFPVRKSGEAPEAFSGTLVTRGRGGMRVTAIGVDTQMGKIGVSLIEIPPPDPRMTLEVRALVRRFAIAGLAVGVVIVVSLGLASGRWLDALLIGLATEMSLLPEEFPLVLTLLLALGAWRLSAYRVLVRAPAAIETLGAVSALCVDKTGTLTENRMTIPEGDGAGFRVEDSVVREALRACHTDQSDPMERAIFWLAEERGIAREAGAESAGGSRRLEIPLSTEAAAVSVIYRDGTAATKGAPEQVLSWCSNSSEQKASIASQLSALAARGYRVLGVARSDRVPEGAENHAALGLKWVGLLPFVDPVRADVPEAVKDCQRAGIRVLMMTGDHRETALSVAREIGIGESDVRYRMTPDQKLAVVRDLQAQGEIVAMTGDGVNDAPSLRAANVGIAMGARGTDVAREAASIVLMDDRFASIVEGIERGRLIYANIRKAIGYIASIHVPIAGVALLPAVFGGPVILEPIHIVFLELFIDPSGSLLFENQADDPEIMRNPPRDLAERLLDFRRMMRALLHGCVVLAACVSAYWAGRSHLGFSEGQVRAFVFGILVVSNLGLLFADLTSGSWVQLKRLFQRAVPYATLVLVFGAFGSTVLFVPARALFHFEPLDAQYFGYMIAVGIAVFVIVSAWNALSGKPMGNQSRQHPFR